MVIVNKTRKEGFKHLIAKHKNLLMSGILYQKQQKI